jgi:hypothetical protein
MTLTFSLIGHLEVLGQIKLWSPATMKRNRGAVLRFGRLLGRLPTVEDLNELEIDRFATEMAAKGLAAWTVDRDRLVLLALAKHVAGVTP